METKEIYTLAIYCLLRDVEFGGRPAKGNQWNIFHPGEARGQSENKSNRKLSFGTYMGIVELI